MKNLIDYRFGFGTWQEILKLRADRLREEKEEQERIIRQKRASRQKTIATLQIFGVAGGAIVVTFLFTFMVIELWLR